MYGADCNSVKIKKKKLKFNKTYKLPFNDFYFIFILF